MKNRSKFLVFKGENSEWFWSLYANNNEIIAQSEGYQTKQGAMKGVRAVRAVAVSAAMLVEEEHTETAG